MKKVLIADDHSLVRYGLKIAIQNHLADYEVAESWDGNSVMAQLKKNNYDLVLLDLNMPDTDPTMLLHWIRNFHPETKVLVVSMNNENVFGKRSLQLGAHGYLEKDASPEEFARAVSMIMNGKKYMSPNLSDIIINDTLAGKSINPFDELTPREFQVAMYIIQDYTVTEISNLMQLQYTSVSTFRRRIFEKLNVSDRKSLMSLADAYSLN